MVLMRREVGRSDRQKATGCQKQTFNDIACWSCTEEPGMEEYEELSSRSCTKVGKRIVPCGPREDPAMPEP